MRRTVRAEPNLALRCGLSQPKCLYNKQPNVFPQKYGVGIDRDFSVFNLNTPARIIVVGASFGDAAVQLFPLSLVIEIITGFGCITNQTQRRSVFVAGRLHREQLNFSVRVPARPKDSLFHKNRFPKHTKFKQIF